MIHEYMVRALQRISRRKNKNIFKYVLKRLKVMSVYRCCCGRLFWLGLEVAKQHVILSHSNCVMRYICLGVGINNCHHYGVSSSQEYTLTPHTSNIRWIYVRRYNSTLLNSAFENCRLLYKLVYFFWDRHRASGRNQAEGCSMECNMLAQDRSSWRTLSWKWSLSRNPIKNRTSRRVIC